MLGVTEVRCTRCVSSFALGAGGRAASPLRTTYRKEQDTVHTPAAAGSRSAAGGSSTAAGTAAAASGLPTCSGRSAGAAKKEQAGRIDEDCTSAPARDQPRSMGENGARQSSCVGLWGLQAEGYGSVSGAVDGLSVRAGRVSDVGVGIGTRRPDAHRHDPACPSG